MESKKYTFDDDFGGSYTFDDSESQPTHPEAFFEEIVICCRFQNRSLQPQAESGSCVVLSGHLAAMMGPRGRPGGVEVGYPPRTPAQARVCTAPGDVPAPCPRSPRGYRYMVRIAIGMNYNITIIIISYAARIH